MHDLMLLLSASLLTLAAVAVGAAVGGLPNRGMQTRLNRMLDQQEAVSRRASDLLLAGGDIPSFTALTRTDTIQLAAPPAVTKISDADEALRWAESHRENGYDSPDDIPEYL